jgi:hypothetical protein
MAPAVEVILTPEARRILFATLKVSVRAVFPVYVIFALILQLLSVPLSAGNTTVRLPVLVRWLVITLGWILAETPPLATVSVLPVMLQLVPEVPVCPLVEMVRCWLYAVAIWQINAMAIRKEGIDFPELMECCSFILRLIKIEKTDMESKGVYEHYPVNF